jgi:hypothetical protein
VRVSVKPIISGAFTGIEARNHTPPFDSAGSWRAGLDPSHHLAPIQINMSKNKPKNSSFVILDGGPAHGARPEGLVFDGITQCFHGSSLPSSSACRVVAQRRRTCPATAGSRRSRRRRIARAARTRTPVPLKIFQP